MAKLRHIGVTVPDMEAAAQFYEKTFEMNRVFESPIVIMLSDGIVSLAILKFKTDEQARVFMTGKAAAERPRLAGGPRVKAPWKPEDPGLITPNTKIYVAPPLPRRVFKTNTYLQF